MEKGRGDREGRQGGEKDQLWSAADG